MWLISRCSIVDELRQACSAQRLGPIDLVRTTSAEIYYVENNDPRIHAKICCGHPRDDPDVLHSTILRVRVVNNQINQSEPS
jgi:hypothetical protein